MCDALVLCLRSRNCSLSQTAQTCPRSGIHFLPAWFSDFLGMMSPGEQGPRNVICITAAARHVLASLCQHPCVVAAAPGAMVEAGQKWELLRLGHVSHRAALLGLGRKHPSCMFYLEAAPRAVLHLQLGGYLVRLALFQGNNSQILKAYLAWSGLTSPCW